MTGFPYSEEGAITSIALGPLSSERWEPLLLVLSFTRSERKKGRRERTHTKPQPLSGVVEAEGCLEAKIIPLTLLRPGRGTVEHLYSVPITDSSSQTQNPEPAMLWDPVPGLVILAL